MSRLFRSVVASLAATVALLLFSGSAHALLPKHQCSFCHSLHGSDTGFVPRSDQINVEVLCMGCHLTANGTTNAVQPHRSDDSTAPYPQHYITCTDCHEVHDNMPNWRKNDPNHAAQDNARGRTGDVRPSGWPVGVNDKMVGREDPDGQTPYAIILTKEADYNKDGIPDRKATVTQTCNASVINDCYVTKKRHVIFENSDPDSAGSQVSSIHGWADYNEDAMQPTGPTPQWGETITNFGDTTYPQGAPHDAICQMCHSKTAKNSCGFDWTVGRDCSLHNQNRTCTNCHQHDQCFDNNGTCVSAWTVPNRDLRAISLTGVPSSVNTGQSVVLTANVSNAGAVAEQNVTVKFRSNLEGQVGVVVIPTLASGASQNVQVEWITSKAGSHSVTANVQPVLAEVNVANNTATTTVTVQTLQFHDVAVTSITAASPVQQGTTTTVTVQVRNNGTFTESFSVGLASNRTNDGNLPLSLPVASLAPGNTTTLNFSWDTTGADLGTHTLAAAIPVLPTGESNTANNSASTNVVVAIHDVAVTSVTGPPSIDQGTSGTISVVVTNHSGGFTESFNVTLASSLAPNDGNLPQTQVVTNLGPGSLTTLNFSWNTTGATIATHTLTATAATVAGETNTANNSATTTVEVVPLVTHDVAVNSVTAPPSINRGGGATTVAVVVENVGGATETFNVTLASNRDGTIQTLSSGPLAAGNSTTLNFTWNTTTATSLGSHTLTATAATVPGETNTANNSASTTTTVTAHDVAVNSVTAPASTPLGNTVTVSVQVQNVGSFTESFTVTLASNQTLGGNLPLTQNVTNLAAGNTATVNFSWNTTGAFVGTHTLTATASTVTGELNTANNSASTSAAVTGVHDVAINSISANPTTVAQGGTVSISVVAANVGSFTETFDVTVATNQAGRGNLPQTQTVTNLAANSTQTLTFTWNTGTNPKATKTTHTLTATASTVTGETNTANNTKTTTVTVN